MFASAEDLMAHVAAHVGFRAVDEARRATDAVLTAFGPWLPDETRELVAAELPAAQAARLERESVARPIEAHVAELLGVREGIAREIVASVCRAFAEELPARAVIALRPSLPSSIAELLVDSSEALPPPRRSRGLAGGRPGSEHPLSEARPDRTQAGSVAETNPHGDRKLSSSH